MIYMPNAHGAFNWAFPFDLTTENFLVNVMILESFLRLCALVERHAALDLLSAEAPPAGDGLSGDRIALFAVV
jgi:hypothetical protein